MTIYRVEHNKNYTTINNSIAKDNRLSYRAKGIWLYAFSRPDDWSFNIVDIMNQSTDGKDSVQSALKELETCGYLIRTQGRDESNKFKRYEWIFYETPREIKEIFPQPEKPEPASPRPENPPLLSTDSLLSTEKEQQQEAPPPKQIVAVFSCLEQQDIPLDEKIWLSKTYDEETVQYAITWLHHPLTKISTTNIQALKWACKNKPDLPKSIEDIEQENKRFAMEIEENTYKHPERAAYFEVLHKTIEIGYTASQSTPFVMEYTRNEFKKILISTLKKYGFITKETNTKGSE
jgi:hypothetical protein